MTWPQLGFGTSPYRAGGRRVDLENAVALAAGAGFRLFDTAEMYGNESAVGRALRRSGVPRRELVIVGKAWRTSFRPEHLRAACEASLRRLGIDAFDAYLLHAPEAWRHVAALDDVEAIGWAELERRLVPGGAAGEPPAEAVALAETWAAMRELQRAGLAKSVGVSNFAPAHLALLGGPDPGANQIACSPRRPQRALCAWCAKRGVTLLVHSPLSGDGALTDGAVTTLAREWGLPPAALLLAWHRQRGAVPLCSSLAPEHIAENAESLAVTLPAPAIEALEALGSTGLTLAEGAP